jgi:cupin fold WbuC family metalloprotein
MSQFKRTSEEIIYAQGPVVSINHSDLAMLKRLADENPRKRVRICAHPDTDDALHEMVIVHKQGNYIPPHCHKGKSESFHIIEGKAEIILFTESGTPTQKLVMNARNGDGTIFYRLQPNIYHTLIPVSEYVIFHEVTNGPFKREETEFATWAPCEDEPHKHVAYIDKIRAAVQ